MKRVAILTVALILAAPRLVTAQASPDRGAGALAEQVRNLGVTARVLMIGAHPDDEDTPLITWLARGRGVETAYLSLTRGDGGQNLIGNELGEALGVIRTEELLAARRIDGGQQFFARAYDFGFSKSAEETYRHWPKDSILRDVVMVIRTFRPHVIVALFSGTPRDGHGHHQVSGLLAREAFDVSGDTARFPADAHLPAWTALKFYRSARGAPAEATVRVDVGEYSPLVGGSYAEIAAISRSQHKSQGFGSIQRRGPVTGYLRLEASRIQGGTRDGGIFDGIDTTWARLAAAAPSPRARAAADSLPGAIAAVRAAFDAFEPRRLIRPLARVQALVHRACEPPPAYGCIVPASNGDGARVPSRRADLVSSYQTTMARVTSALQHASGIVAEANVSRELWPVGASPPIVATFYNRGPDTVTVHGPEAIPQGTVNAKTRVVAPSGVLRDTVSDTVRSVSEPWWLHHRRRGDVFAPPSEQYLFDPAFYRFPPEVIYEVRFGTGGSIRLHVPVTYRYADPVRGEVQRPLAGAPAISIALGRSTEFVRANAAIDRTLRVELRTADDARRDVRVSLQLPAGLTVDSASRSVSLLRPGERQVVAFRVSGRLAPGAHLISAIAESGGERFTRGYQLIDYEHIQPQRMYRPATVQLTAVDAAVPAGLTVAYVPGVSDNVAPAIEQLGIPVRVVSPTDIARLNPTRDRILVIGPRAYESNDTLMANAPAVLDFARRGGTIVVQYGQHEMTQPGIMPYPITLERRADRVTEEDAPVRVLDPASPVLTAPNRITDRDFVGWVQERALYMPRSFDPRYHAPLSMNDPGEPANRGAILVAPLGRGTYVYTTLAFFRQLPAGHAGAARLFVNLLAAGRHSTAP